MTPKLTKEQAVIISGYTGVLICDLADFHEDVKKRLRRPVWTHEFAVHDISNDGYALS